MDIASGIFFPINLVVHIYFFMQNYFLSYSAVFLQQIFKIVILGMASSAVTIKLLKFTEFEYR